MNRISRQVILSNLDCVNRLIQECQRRLAKDEVEETKNKRSGIDRRVSGRRNFPCCIRLPHHDRRQASFENYYKGQHKATTNRRELS